MAVGSPPTVRRRQLGRELRRLRERASMHGDQLAERLRCSASRISRIETARIRISPGAVHEILDVLEIDGPERDRLVHLAWEAEQPAWWQEYTDTLPPAVTAYYSLESEAATLRAFEPTIVHGLLQTDDYVRALTRHWRPQEEYVEAIVESRRSRRTVLTRPKPLRLSVVLDEAVLHRRVGGATVMADQLHRLIELAGQPHLDLRVIPFAAGMHSGPGGSFGILGFGDDDEPDVAYVESANDQNIIEREAVVRGYGETFERLRGEALDPAASRTLIARLLTHTG